MKRKIILSIALALSIILVSLIKSDSIVAAEIQTKFVFDTGVITLGPNQDLRLSVLSGTPTANGSFNFRVRRFGYAQDSCTGGVCKLSVDSQTASDLITLLPGEAAFFDIPAELQVVRAVVVTE